MALPNPGCNCCTCTIFTDSFTGSSLDTALWDVLSGTMTVDTVADNAEIAAISEVAPVTDQPTGSGGLTASIGYARDAVTIRFAYADSNNYWRMTTEAGTLHIGDSGGSPVIIDTVLCKFYECIAGSEEYIGSRHVAYNETGGAPDLLSSSFCWHEGGRVRVIITPSSGAAGVELHWPNHVTGGNSFRIEPQYDMIIDGVTWSYHTIEHPGLGDCACSSYNCLTCVDDWGDTMTVEITTGGFAGNTMVADRHRDWPTIAPYAGRAQDNVLSYWHFTYLVELEGDLTPVDPDNEDWDVYLDFCFGSGEADDNAQLTIESYSGLGSPDGTDEFTVDDCAGPWEATISGETLEITPSAP